MFGPWNAFAKLKRETFAADAQAVLEPWKEAAPPNWNTSVVRRFVDRPPASMVEVAQAYGELFAKARQDWQSLVASTAAAGGATPQRLPDGELEQLRDVLYAIDSPVAVPRQEALWEYLYDAPINNEITKRRNAINQHLAQTAPAPPAGPHPGRVAPGAPATNPGPRQSHPPRQAGAAPISGSAQSHGSQTLCDRQRAIGFARAVASRDNPLTARVIVNRIWAHHFGAGLVRTPSNFGLRGQPPSHPELLDHLANRLMDEGWSLKKLHRLIMLSSTYQQSSRDRADYRQRDPENRLLWKMNRRRLDFEAQRDAMLVAAGRLDRTIGGPSVDVANAETGRRSVYALIDRQALPGMLPTFDFASPDAHSPERYTTTVPSQALFLMNGALANRLARVLAAREDLTAILAPAERAAWMIQVAWSREATAEERTLAVEFIERDKGDIIEGQPGSWEGWRKHCFWRTSSCMSIDGRFTRCEVLARSGMGVAALALAPCLGVPRAARPRQHPRAIRWRSSRHTSRRGQNG